jgi:hypothetical protein
VDARNRGSRIEALEIAGSVVGLHDELGVRGIGGIAPARDFDVDLTVVVGGIVVPVNRPSTAFGSSPSTREAIVQRYVP